jgi:hypothetical protein
VEAATGRGILTWLWPRPDQQEANARTVLSHCTAGVAVRWATPYGLSRSAIFELAGPKCSRPKQNKRKIFNFQDPVSPLEALAQCPSSLVGLVFFRCPSRCSERCCVAFKVCV